MTVLTDGTHKFLAVTIIIKAAKTERPLITTLSTAELPYCLESQNPPGHIVTAVMFRDTTEETFCTVRTTAHFQISPL